MALSTNAPADSWANTTAAELEGGFISTDSANHWGQDLYNAGASIVPAAADGDSTAVFRAGLQTDGRLDYRFRIEFQDVRSMLSLRGHGAELLWRYNVRLIEPLVDLLHPEGGQIAIIDPPAAGMSGLTIPSMDAESRLARRTLGEPAAETNFDAHQTHQVDGLRGRAVVFEVADFKARPNVKGNGLARMGPVQVSHELAASLVATDAVYHETSSDPARASRLGVPTTPNRASTTNARTHNQAEGAYVRAFQLAQAQAMGWQFGDSTGASLSPPNGDGSTNAAPDDDAHVARDVALAQLGQGDLAPTGDAGAASLEARSRKVLAMALILALGSGSVGKFFLRRRTPDKATEQRPPRRRRLFHFS